MNDSPIIPIPKEFNKATGDALYALYEHIKIVPFHQIETGRALDAKAAAIMALITTIGSILIPIGLTQ